jgi:hypothetical protein
MEERIEHINRFYSLINELESFKKKRSLKNSTGKVLWPKQGIYYFFERTENRENGNPKVVRIGTHAVSKGSKTKYWERLRQHKGTKKGTGNHRGSVFRKLIGKSLISKHNLNLEFSEWGKNKTDKNNKQKEEKLELQVSEIIGKMEFLSLSVPGESNKNNMRAYIETNSIALLSNRNKKEKIDLPSENWLGSFSGHNHVLESGLWNSDDTEKNYDSKFLDKLEELIKNQINISQ